MEQYQFEVSTKNRIFFITCKSEDTFYIYDVSKSDKTPNIPKKQISRYNSMTKILKHIQVQTEKEYNKQKQRDEKKIIGIEKRKSVQVGDIFYTSWGYDNTYVDFFQVVSRKSAAKVVVREIAKIATEEHYMSNSVYPDVNNFTSDEKICTIDYDGRLSNIDEYGHKGYKTNKETKHYQSWGN